MDAGKVMPLPQWIEIIQVYDTAFEEDEESDFSARTTWGLFSHRESVKDPKTALQEFLQARQHELPRYETAEVSGPPHDQVFTVNCHVDALGTPVSACGRSRRKAEQAAARTALRLLKEHTA